jgi:hypothetical protein
MEVNIPEVVAEVRGFFERYEAALIANDVEFLNGCFWQSDLTVRYGVAENLYGYDQIVGFRAAATPVAGRTLRNTVITTFGRDFAAISTEFVREGQSRVGRQTQVLVRCPEGWRIAAAHVSLMAG